MSDKMSRNSLVTVKAIPGWLVVFGIGGWNLIDVLSNIDWIFTIGSNPQVQRVWNLLTTPAGSLVLLGVGLAWLIVCARMPISPPTGERESRLTQDEHGTRLPEMGKRRNEPNLVLLSAELQHLSVSEHYAISSDPNGKMLAVCAKFRNEVMADSRVGSALFTKAHITVTADGATLLHVDAGVWLGEDFNTTEFSPSDTRTLLLCASANEEEILFVNDRRESVERYDTPEITLLNRDFVVITVRLVDPHAGLAREFVFRVDKTPIFRVQVLKR